MPSSANLIARSAAPCARTTAKVCPPSVERRIAPPAPAAQATDDDREKYTAYRSLETGDRTALQVLPPSLVESSVPPAPAAMPCCALPEEMTRRSAIVDE